MYNYSHIEKTLIEMKIYFFTIFFVIIIAFPNCLYAQGETQIDKYFSSYVIPETWFPNTSHLEYENYSKRVKEVNRYSINFFNLPNYYSFEKYMPFANLNLLVKGDRFVSQTAKYPYSPYKTEFFLQKERKYNWFSMAFLYKSEPLDDLTKNVLSEQLLVQNIDKYNTSNLDTIDYWFEQNSFNTNKFKRKIIYSNPNFVEYDWDDIPDLPKDIWGGKNRTRHHEANDNFRVVPLSGMEYRSIQKLEKVDKPKQTLTYSGSENIQFSQSYLENWVKGGQSTVSLLSDLRLKILYKEDKVEWENLIIHKVGIMSDDDIKKRINDDLIDFSSKYGVAATKKWFYSLLFNFKSQFFNGYDKSDINKENPISSFMAPAYFSMAAGMDFKTKNFTILLSPVTFRSTVVLDTAKVNQTRYSIPDDKKAVFFTGGSFQNNLTWNITKSIKLTSALNVFYDYLEKENKVQADWDMILDMKINVFLSSRIVSNMRYYENESDKLQIREGLSIAFRYNF